MRIVKQDSPLSTPSNREKKDKTNNQEKHTGQFYKIQGF
jgi:hypothetical protein